MAVGLARFLGLTLAILLAYMIGGLVLGIAAPSSGGNPAASPSDAGAVLGALLGVCAIDALVLAVILHRARWHGWKLVMGTFALMFGVETLLSQIEALFFGSALAVDRAAVARLVLTGGVRAAVVAPAAVGIMGKMPSKPTAEAPLPGVPMQKGLWTRTVSWLAAVYLLVYVLFGYFVAWQFEEVRVFYSGSAELRPFFAHLWNGLLLESQGLLPLQLFRGGLWAGLGIMVVRMTRGGALSHSLLVALLFGGVFPALCLIPNPYMPPGVRHAHFLELLLSMLLFGALAGWALSRQNLRNERAGPEANVPGRA
jgi:hypothetical protein